MLLENEQNFSSWLLEYILISIKSSDIVNENVHKVIIKKWQDRLFKTIELKDGLNSSLLKQ